MGRLYGEPWFRRRVRSPENVVREVETVKAASGLAFVQFRCSMFPYEIDWLEEFAALYKRRVGLPFYCHVRANHMSAAVVRLLASAGCKSVNMGIECADERYRENVLNRPMPNETIRAACRRLHEHGVAILADNMVGLPGRTLEDDIETLRLNVECQVDYPLAMILQPYPGTQIDRYARENGHFDGDYSQIGYNYYFRSPLRFRNAAEKSQIENLQKLFAVAAEAPRLLPLLRRLIRLPGNLVFMSIFRWWYAWCYHRRIMRYPLSWADLAENVKVLFGIYPKEAFRESPEEALSAAQPGDGRDAGNDRWAVSYGLPQSPGGAEPATAAP
jgi:anaerobic magnesium-protoporphyrin IX monomethyl ester cyclase